MTVASSVRKAGPFTGNGVTTSWPFSFKVFAKTDIQVVRTSTLGVEATLVLDSDYSVTLNADQDANPGGTIAYATLPIGEKLTVIGSLVAEQGTELENGGGFFPRVIEDRLDYLTILIQQLQEIQGRSIKLSASDADITLPGPGGRANTILAFDETGAPTLATGIGQQLLSQAIIAQFYRPQAPSEASAGVVPTNFARDSADSASGADARRYNAIGSGLINEYAALQTWLNANAGRTVVLPPGTYRIDTGLTVPAGTVISGYGATLTTSQNITMLTAGSGVEILGLNFVGPGSAYNAASFGIFASGTRNGAGVAPTYGTGLVVRDCTFTNIANTPIELRYWRNASIETCVVSGAGYCGVSTLSSELVRVRNSYIASLTGETASGELNAYGVTFTADNGSSDFTRDPPSRDCLVSDCIIANIPTWHALDTHGGERCTFRNNIMIDCRRGAIITNRTTESSKYCVVQGNLYVNTWSPTDTNPNGTRKRGEAFWDIGASSSLRSTGNSIIDNVAYFAGNPVDSAGAAFILNAQDGEFANNRLVGCYNTGIVVDANVRRYEIGENRIVDVRSVGTGAGSPTNFPQALRFEGDFLEAVTVRRNYVGRKNAALDTAVMQIGVLFQTFSNRSIFLADNTFEAVPTVFSGSQTGVTGDVSGSFTATSTGVTGSPTGSVTFRRSGNVVVLHVPQIGGTSNATTFTLTGLPAHLIPAANRLLLARGQDNSAFVHLVARIDSAGGTITLLNGVGAGSFTASGTKTIEPCALTYSLD